MCGGAERKRSTSSDVWAHETPYGQGVRGGSSDSQVCVGDSREFPRVRIGPLCKAESRRQLVGRGIKKDMNHQHEAGERKREREEKKGGPLVARRVTNGVSGGYSGTQGQRGLTW